MQGHAQKDEKSGKDLQYNFWWNAITEKLI
jgi:hypothetical protein